MNYHGKPRDVMTLAHELGHGIHQVLAAPQGHFLANTPLTLAETASVFGEMLTFQSMLESAQDVTARRVMLASKVEDMLNTVIRQIAFYQFEERVHEERRQGELSADRLGEIWMEVQTDSLGPLSAMTMNIVTSGLISPSSMPHSTSMPMRLETVWLIHYMTCLQTDIHQFRRSIWTCSRQGNPSS